MATLNKKLQQKAEEELNEKPGRREQDIDILRKLVTSNKALTCRTDDSFLLRFLRTKKFDCERANQLLINYFTVREEHKDRLGELRPSLLKHVLEQKLTMVLPHRDKEGRRILYFRSGNWDPKKIPIWDILRVNILNMDKVAEEEETQINGVVAIGNMEGAGWEHATAGDREYNRVSSKLMQDALPLRFKGMFVVNEPGIFDFMMTIARPFLSEKTQSRITVIGNDLNKLHKIFDPAILPEELGGDLPNGDIIATEWNKKLMDSEAYFVEATRNKIQTTRAIMKGKSDDVTSNNGTIMGSGTFRKLNVD